MNKNRPDCATFSTPFGVMEELLARLELSQFAAKLRAEDIDIEAAALLSEDDLKNLGLTLGARKKLYNALHSSPTAQVARSATATPAAAAPNASVSRAAPAPPSVKASGPPPPPPLVGKLSALQKSTYPAVGKIPLHTWRWDHDAEPWGGT